MSVALRGNLKDFGIAEVFQLIGHQRKTGVLEFAGGGQRVELRFDRGSVVSAAPVGSRPGAALAEMLVRCGVLTRERVEQLHRASESSARSFEHCAISKGWVPEEVLAEIEELLTRETIFAVMSWSSGSFDFTTGPVEYERPLESLLGAEQILMDGLRMVDEWQSFARHVPSQDTVFERVGTFDEYRDRAREEVRRRLAAAERIFFLIDGRLSVRRIVDLSRLGTFDATRILADLRRVGVIAPLDSASARQRLRRRRVTRLDRGHVRRGLAALFPLLLLALVAAATLRSGLPRAPVRAFELERAPLAAAAESYASRRVRHALEVYRFGEGRWPERLADLRERGLLDNHALAFAAGRPYHYEQRDGGVVLLAPER